MLARTAVLLLGGAGNLAKAGMKISDTNVGYEVDTDHDM
jgi:hypothetical protein